MKTLILTFLLIASMSYGQNFSHDVGAGLGLEIDNKGEFTELLGKFEAQSKLTIGILDIGLVATTIVNPKLPKFLIGPEAGVRIWESPDKRTNLGITARYQYGNQGKQLIWAGLRYGIDRTILSATGNWDYKNKTAGIFLNGAYTIIK